MDLATDLVYLKKLLITVENHYQNPHGEATTVPIESNQYNEGKISVNKLFKFCL